MNIEINPDYEKSTTLRALSAFLTLLADEAEGETKDGLILSAIVQKGLRNDDESLKEHIDIRIAELQASVLHPEQEDEAEAQARAIAPIVEAAPPKRTRRTKAEMAADAGNVSAVVVKPASPASTAAAALPATSESGPGTADLTIDDVRAALQRYTAVHGMPDGIALLKNYGAGRISELGLEQYPLFIAECDAPAAEAA